MAEKKSFSIKGLFKNNNFVLLFSLIAAIIFWMVLTVTESDSENTVAGINVSIPIENSVVSEMGLDVIGDTTGYQAAVTVKGPAYVVGTLTPNDIAVTASISGVTSAGGYELELRASKQAGSVNNEFEIVSISPSTITVNFDYIDTKQFVVTAQAIGASAIEGLVAENPVVSDSNYATLTFKGSRTNIDKIAKVVAVAEVNQVLSETKTFKSVLEIYDAENNKLSAENYTITAADGLAVSDVQVSVPISKMKTVEVKAQFTNMPDAFKNNAIAHSLSYATLDIIGPPETIDNITSVSLSEINFDEISENNQQFEVSLILPDGVKSVDNVESVTVTINGLNNYVVRTFTVSNLSTSSANGSATLSRNIRNVKICGPKSELDKISSDDLFAEVAIDGLQSGEHTVSARIKSKTSDKIWQVGSYTATVNVK